MKKMKMFFAAAALTLVTVGVFAGKAKFFSNTDLYYFDGTSHFNAMATGAITLGSGFSVSTSSTGAVKVAIPNVNGGAAVGLYTFVSPALTYQFIVD